MSRRLLDWRWSVSACALALMPSLAFGEDPPPGQIRTYRSQIDNSDQAYGLYLPRANPPSDDGFPVVMHAHGYGWSVSAGFSVWQRRWADDHGWVLININGRGPNFYDGIGEDDVMRALEDVGTLVPVDRRRVYMTGGSMGGTGAYRVGVRRPDVFSGAAPVDGWTDYRLFHKHWYERKDMPDAIEEFRRPLLEAVSVLFTAGTARWGDLYHVTDAQDNVVWPNNGLGYEIRVWGEFITAQDQFNSTLIINPGLGHGQGYDLPAIYDHFLGVTGHERPPTVTVETTLLRYGEVHWGRIDRFHVQGGMGRLDVEKSGTAAHVTTRNLDGFTLMLPDSPLADLDRVQVVADGVPCYDGPVREASFAGVRNDQGGLLLWEQTDLADRPLRKRPGLEGPIGEAFLHPFVVIWGSAGDANDVRTGRIEAEDFAREWNAFNVHYDAVKAKPEDELTEDERRARNLIIFGTLDSSSILRQADAATQLPVLTFRDRIVVRDPEHGDRTYAGAKYGAFWVYPNPLNGSRTFIVCCKGRFATRADGSVRRGLGYDLEKLQWGWGDYVVFDSDIDDLAYVINVNNKEPVLCYEAGYFTEAGFFDRDWGIDRGAELSRVRALRPERWKLIHVDAVEAHAGADPRARVRIVDHGAGPVEHARVTLQWSGAAEGTYSRKTDREGWATFPSPESASDGTVRAEVVNVCATGATYDWPEDRAREAALTPGDAAEISLTMSPETTTLYEGGAATFHLNVSNHSARPLSLILTPSPGIGVVTPDVQELSVAAGTESSVHFVWDSTELPPGDYAVPVSVRARAGAAAPLTRSAVARLTVEPVSTPDIAVVKVDCWDRRRGEAFEVYAEVENRDKDRYATVTVSCVIVEARRHLPSQEVRLGPGAKVGVRWRQEDGSRPLDVGVYHAKVSVPEMPGAIGQRDFVVR